MWHVWLVEGIYGATTHHSNQQTCIEQTICLWLIVNCQSLASCECIFSGSMRHILSNIYLSYWYNVISTLGFRLDKGTNEQTVCIWCLTAKDETVQKLSGIVNTSKEVLQKIASLNLQSHPKLNK